MTPWEREALLRLREHALPEDAPGAWVRAAIDRMIAEAEE